MLRYTIDPGAGAQSRMEMDGFGDARLPPTADVLLKQHPQGATLRNAAAL